MKEPKQARRFGRETMAAGNVSSLSAFAERARADSVLVAISRMLGFLQTPAAPQQLRHRVRATALVFACLVSACTTDLASPRIWRAVHARAGNAQCYPYYTDPFPIAHQVVVVV